MKISIYEAIKLICSIKTSKKTKIIPLKEALNQINAKDIKATIPLPRYNNSAMDGYAIKGASTRYKIVGSITAGEDKDIKLNENECIKITTGAKVPAQCDAVVPIEDTILEDDFIKIDKKMKKDANIRFAAEDVKEGEIILKEGTKILSNHIQILASQGITHLKVYQKPKVAIIANGNELKMPYETLQKNQIYNTNSPYLLLRLKELGFDASFIGKSKDSLQDQIDTIKNALDFDLIITTGGASVSEMDFTKEAFLKLGFSPLFEKIDIKPGKPTKLFKKDDKFALILPGNPLAASINFEIFGRALLNTLSFNKQKYPAFIKAKISTNFSKNKNVPSVIPGFFDGEYFNVLDKFGPNMVNVFNRSNGFIVLDKKDLKKDEIVKFLPINWEFAKDEFTLFLT